MLKNLLLNPEKIEKNDHSNLNYQISENRVLVNQVWYDFIWNFILIHPIHFIKLLRNYYIIGQYNRELFIKLENIALRRMAQKLFVRSLQEIQFVVIDLEYTKFKLAKFKPIKSIGSLTDYTNANAYLHNPNPNLFDNMILQTIENARKEDGLFFDIGAHTGLYSMLACGVGFEVISVEANPDISKVIKINKKLNGFKNIQIINKAVGKTQGKVVLGGLDPRPGSRVIDYKENSRLVYQPVIKQVTLDDLSDEFGFPTIIKIDIEGLEVDALSGAKKIIEKGITTFLIDIHQNYLSSRNVSPQFFLDIFPRERWCFSTSSEEKEVVITAEDTLNHHFVKISPVI